MAFNRELRYGVDASWVWRGCFHRAKGFVPVLSLYAKPNDWQKYRNLLCLASFLALRSFCCLSRPGVPTHLASPPRSPSCLE